MAVLHDVAAVREALRLGLVRDDEDSCSPVSGVAQEGEDSGGVRAIEAGGRLVCEDDGRWPGP